MRAGLAATAGWARQHRLDIAALVGLLAGFFLVHDVGTSVSAPYMLDETWVAISTRVPLGDLPDVTSSTPIGWTLLLRLVGDQDALRVVPLTFALLGVAAAYAFGRSLPWTGRVQVVVAGGLAGSAVVLVPAAQLRHDLKQYTADAALAFTLLLLAERADRAGESRRPLVTLAVAGPVAFLFSSVSALVTAASFGGLVLAAAARRDWPRLVARLVAGLAAGAALAALYLAFVAPGRVPALVRFWQAYYPAPTDLPGYLADRVLGLAPWMGFGPWWAWLLLASGGVVVLFRMRAAATATAIVLLLPVAVVLGMLRLYPLLEERTSYFLVAITAALAGLLVARVTAVIARGPSRARPALEPALAAAAALAAVGVFAMANHSWYHYAGPTAITLSDVRTQVRWVDDHRRPGDVILLSLNARYGYLLYHDQKPIRWRESDTFSTGWDVVMPDDPNLIVDTGGTFESIDAAVERAVSRARANGPDGRLLLVRSWC